MEWIENVLEQERDTLAIAISALSIGISGILLLIKLWETFWRDRIRLETSYFLTSERDVPSEIIIANLSPLPVQVAHWRLVWEPRWFSFWIGVKDVSPDETDHFKVNERDTYRIAYEFQWNAKVSSGRQLVLRLKRFGRRRWIKLVVGAGHDPNWFWRIKRWLRPLRA